MTQYSPDDGGRGNPGLSIHFIDVKTSKLIRDALVLSPDEYDDSVAGQSTMRAVATRRAATIQRMLDAGHFRSLTSLGSSNADFADDAADKAKLHAEFVGENVRLVDPDTRTVVWRRDLSIAAPRPIRADDGDDMCMGWTSRGIAVWWDPQTRVVLAPQNYATGGCMCPIETIERVLRIGDL